MRQLSRESSARYRERRNNHRSATATPSAAAAGKIHFGYPVGATGRSISRRAGTTTGVAFDTEALGSEASEGSTRKKS
jgi:hypothetical protein